MGLQRRVGCGWAGWNGGRLDEQMVLSELCVGLDRKMTPWRRSGRLREALTCGLVACGRLGVCWRYRAAGNVLCAPRLARTAGQLVEGHQVRPVNVPSGKLTSHVVHQTLLPHP